MVSLSIDPPPSSRRHKERRSPVLRFLQGNRRGLRRSRPLSSCVSWSLLSVQSMVKGDRPILRHSAGQPRRLALRRRARRELECARIGHGPLSCGYARRRRRQFRLRICAAQKRQYHGRRSHHRPGVRFCRQTPVGSYPYGSPDCSRRPGHYPGRIHCHSQPAQGHQPGAGADQTHHEPAGDRQGIGRRQVLFHRQLCPQDGFHEQTGLAPGLC